MIGGDKMKVVLEIELAKGVVIGISSDEHNEVDDTNQQGKIGATKVCLNDLVSILTTIENEGLDYFVDEATALHDKFKPKPDKSQDGK